MKVLNASTRMKALTAHETNTRLLELVLAVRRHDRSRVFRRITQVAHIGISRCGGLVQLASTGLLTHACTAPLAKSCQMAVVMLP